MQRGEASIFDELKWAIIWIIQASVRWPDVLLFDQFVLCWGTSESFLLGILGSLEFEITEM